MNSPRPEFCESWILWDVSKFSATCICLRENHEATSLQAGRLGRGDGALTVVWLISHGKHLTDENRRPDGKYKAK